MVVGTGQRPIRIAKSLEQAADYGVRLRGFLSEGGPGKIALGSIYPIYRLLELSAIVREHVVDEIIFAVDSTSLSNLEEVFFAVRSRRHPYPRRDGFFPSC